MAAPSTDRTERVSTARDRFDAVPKDLRRVGAHRAKAHPGRGWIGVGWSVLAIVILSAGGLWGLTQVNQDLNFELPIFAPEETTAPKPDAPVVEEAEPVLDPKIVITVLNGTTTSGYSNTVADYLVAQGWKGAEFGVGARVNASSSDVETTQVYYNNPANEAAARAMLDTLGVGELVLSNDYPASPLAILVGSDLIIPTE